MAGSGQNRRRVVSFLTNGKLGDRYGLSERVGQLVKRGDDAAKKAIASTARKASPMAKALLTARYSLPPGQITNRVSTRVDPQTLHVDASLLRFPLSMFRGRWGGASTPGATASILLAQTRTYASAFIAPGRFRGVTMPLIYSRKKGRKVLMTHGRYKGKQRERIVVNRGPSVHDMLTGREAGGTPVGTGENLSAILSAQLVAFYVTELRRLYALESNG